jgi:hypothetical protein
MTKPLNMGEFLRNVETLLHKARRTPAGEPVEKDE